MLTWTDVEQIAARMGANALTIKKWRQRGVPARWKLDIIAAMRRKGVDGADKFPAPIAPKRSRK